MNRINRMLMPGALVLSVALPLQAGMAAAAHGEEKYHGWSVIGETNGTAHVGETTSVSWTTENTAPSNDGEVLFRLPDPAKFEVTKIVASVSGWKCSFDAAERTGECPMRAVPEKSSFTIEGQPLAGTQGTTIPDFEIVPVLDGWGKPT